MAWWVLVVACLSMDYDSQGEPARTWHQQQANDQDVAAVAQDGTAVACSVYYARGCAWAVCNAGTHFYQNLLL
jgi:hypothetical protein